MGNSFKNILVVLLFVIGFCSMGSCTSTQTEPIVIKGSTTMAPLLEKLIQSYGKNKEIQITVEPVGSLAGIKALIQGKCLIACSSAPISTKLVEEADKNGVSLKAFSLCRDQIIAIVNTTNPINQLSGNQLKDLFTGDVSNWADFGGIKAPVHIILRKTISGTHQVWAQKVLSGASFAQTGVVHQNVSSNSGVLAAVADNRYAIGYISASYLNNDVKQLIVMKNKKSVSIERTLFLYVDTHRFSKGIKAFISYLYSAQARQIIQSSGFISDTLTKPPAVNL